MYIKSIIGRFKIHSPANMYFKIQQCELVLWSGYLLKSFLVQNSLFLSLSLSPYCSSAMKPCGNTKREFGTKKAVTLGDIHLIWVTQTAEPSCVKICSNQNLFQWLYVHENAILSLKTKTPLGKSLFFSLPAKKSKKKKVWICCVHLCIRVRKVLGYWNSMPRSEPLLTWGVCLTPVHCSLGGEGCDAFRIEISKVTTPDSAAAAAEHFPSILSPSVSHIALPRTAVVICTDEVPLRKWDQEETKKKKKSSSNERLPKVLVCRR